MVRPLTVETTEGPGGANLILSVDGELDISTIPVLTRHIDERIGSDYTTLTLDLSELTFMDSSGLRLLIELDRRAQQEKWKLSLIRSKHKSANLVLRITGADTALPFQ
jgi:anti-sigma B factor antagonist